jgi:hypothetical protein
MKSIKNIIVYRGTSPLYYKNDLRYFEVLLKMKDSSDTIMLPSSEVVMSELKNKGIEKLIVIIFNNIDLEFFIRETKKCNGIKKIAISAVVTVEEEKLTVESGMEVVPMPISRKTFFSLLLTD